MKLSNFAVLVEQSLELEKKGKLSEALQTGKKALSVGMAEKAPRLERWKLLVAVARIASKLKDDSQLRFIESILIQKPATQQEASVYAKAMIMQAMYYFAHEEGEKAELIYKQVEEFVQEWNVEDKDYLLAFVYTGLASYFAEKTGQEATKQAIHYALTALSIKQTHNFNVTDLLLLLSSLYDEQGMPIESQFYLHELQEVLGNSPEATSIKSSYLTVKARVELRKGNVFTALQNCIEALRLALQLGSVNIIRNILNLQNIFLIIEDYPSVYECSELVESYARCNSFFSKEVHIYSLLRSCEAALYESRYSDIGEYYLQRVETLCAEYKTHKSSILSVWLFIFLYAIQTRDIHRATIAFAEIETNICHLSDSRKKYVYLICSQFQCWQQNMDKASELLSQANAITLQTDNLIDNLRCIELEISIYTEMGNNAALKVAKEKYEQLYSIFQLTKEQQEQAEALTKYILLEAYREVHKYIQRRMIDMDTAMTALQKNMIRDREALKTEAHHLTLLKNNILVYVEQLCKETSNKVLKNNVVSTLQGMLTALPAENASQGMTIEQDYAIHCTPEVRIKLHRVAPTLNNKELDYCYLLLQGWDKKEICRTINLEYNSLAKFRYRLARKLGLPKNAKIYSFILNLE